MKNKKAQAAMEFLMTYGWAVLVVLLAVGALAYFGVLNPQGLLPEKTIFTAPISNIDSAVVASGTANSVEIAFKNNQGVAILLPLTGDLTPEAGVTCANPVITATYNGAAVVADTTSIPNGATFLIDWNCDDLLTAAESGAKFGGTLTFDYTNAETSQTRAHSGTVSGKYQ